MDTENLNFNVNDYNTAEKLFRNIQESRVSAEIPCSQCGKTVHLPASAESECCSSCGCRISRTDSVMLPQEMIPFSITYEAASKSLKYWVENQFLMPRRFKKQFSEKPVLEGIFLPYWSFSFQTKSKFKGVQEELVFRKQRVQREIHEMSYVKHRYIKGKDWHHTEGILAASFEDAAVCASPVLPFTLTKKFDQWDLSSAIAYDHRHLGKFRTDRYTTSLESAFSLAKEMVKPEITEAVKEKIGGHDQYVNSCLTSYSDVKFRYLVLPHWIGTYTQGSKTWIVTVNGQTGRVCGEYPKSILKIISIAAGTALLFITAGYAYLSQAL